MVLPSAMVDAANTAACFVAVEAPANEFDAAPTLWATCAQSPRASGRTGDEVMRRTALALVMRNAVGSW